jgi:hypothetical protein
MGVIVRVHHLAWYSMAGEAKRDYPATIAWQSPWWPAYPVVEDHFARLNAVLTRGQPLCRVAVVHSVESFWVSQGTRPERIDEVQAQEKAFEEGIRWLVHGLIDFDFLCESLLPSQGAAVENRRLRVGAMAYEAVLLPRLRGIRASTLDRLEAFADAGGRVIFAGTVPHLVDGCPSERADRLAARCMRVGFDRTEILDALAPCRDLDVRLGPGRPRADKLAHQIRAEGDVRWIFACNTDLDYGHTQVLLRLRGDWSFDTLETANGEIAPTDARAADGWTEWMAELPAAGHLLLRASPARAQVPVRPPRAALDPARRAVRPPRLHPRGTECAPARPSRLARGRRPLA